uniref:Mothers against decapentaplegic homolog n=1 Tax=Panagrellus redivivus TaxID=6233 RepID=A0A7E4V2J2_PANRE
MMKLDKLGQGMSSVLKWKQGDEDDGWSKKAIETLTKRLQRHNENAIDQLNKVLENKGREKSECVTIPRSIDGRLQIAHRKALPHVIYCRVYRWPDLQSHNELKAINSCRYCFESGQKDVCINPYHYDRVDSANVLPPVLVPRFPEYPPANMLEAVPRAMQHDQINQMPTNIDTGTHVYNLNAAYPYNVDEDDEMIGKPYQTTPNPQNCISIPFEMDKEWATIFYYEMNTRIGPAIKVSSSTVEINGFTDPTKNPKIISLGLFPNVNRNATTESTRRHIGKGVKLTYVSHLGTLYAECESNNAIFVQSRNCNYLHNFHPTTVCKISRGYSLKIFDASKFRELLEKHAMMGFNKNYDLTKMTIIRMSFVKGWGAEYQRQDVTSTPCWIEIHLHSPLKWLDKALMAMDPSTEPISSVS